MIFSNENCTCKDNYVYLNKIFFNESENASPIMTTINSAQSEFTQQLAIGSNICTAIAANDGCGCGCNCGGNEARCGCSNNCSSNCNCDCCCDFTIGPDTAFNITNAYILVHSFRLTNPATLTADDVTVEGLPITDLTVNGNQFVGDLSDIMAEITKCPCQSPCANNCPGNFVMITADGPWQLTATIVVEGNVYGNGPACQFKICFNTADGTPLAITGPASFAFCGVDIPCQISGASPSLVFDFDACAKLLNPTITVNCMNGSCTPVLTGSLVVTPRANLQVIRASLFNLGDCEVKIPCDDMGQCNPCNAQEAECINPSIACQCCDTNGYGF